MITAVYQSTAQSIGLALIKPETRVVAVASGNPFFCRYDRYWDINNPRVVSSRPVQTHTAESVIKKSWATSIENIVVMYNEPLRDQDELTSLLALAHAHKMNVYVVTYGLDTLAMPKDIVKHVAGVVIQLPSLDDRFYTKMYGEGNTLTVQKSIDFWAQTTAKVQINTVIIPGENDQLHHFKRMIGYIGSLQRTVVWQLERFYPQFQILDKPPLEMKILTQFVSVAIKSGLTQVQVYDPGVNL